MTYFTTWVGDFLFYFENIGNKPPFRSIGMIVADAF